MKLSTFKNFFRSMAHPWKFLFKIFIRVPRLVPDKLFIQVKYKAQLGKWPDLNNPKSFTEKINWLKLYNRDPRYTNFVDKYAVKEYVASCIGKQYIIPTIGVWNRPEQIEWDNLPNQFVLKTTHGGGSSGVIICTDKSKIDKESVMKKLNKSLKSDIYLYFREWPYKNVKRRIICESFMYDDQLPIGRDLSDYKFFCFNGEPKYCQVIRDRRTNETIDFYDMEWNHMPFVGLNPTVSNGLNPVAKPMNLDSMIEICRKLSKDIPFVRVDLYVIKNNVYFGEMTFYPASGIGVFNPFEWDEKLGDLLKL